MSRGSALHFNLMHSSCLLYCKVIAIMQFMVINYFETTLFEIRF